MGRRLTNLDFGVKTEGNRRNMLQFAVRKAVDYELTECQKNAVQMCFYEGKTVSAAARELGLNKSTVSRHLKSARRRIEQSLQYGFFPIWKDNDDKMM